MIKRTILLWLMTLLIAVPVEAGVLDNVNGAYAAYSVRKLNSGYGGPALKVRRTSDGSTQDIGFDGSGNLDVSALNSFCSSADCFVTVWYDQSGGGADLAQSDTELQPQIVQTGKVNTDSNGLARLSFNKSVLSAGGTSISNQNLTAFFMQQSEYSKDLKFLIGIGNPAPYTLDYYLSLERGAVRIGDGSSRASLGDIRRTIQSAWRTIQILDSIGQTVRLFRNSTLIDTQTHSKSESVQSVFQIGSYTGNISEVVLYRALSDLDRVAVYNNINSYFLAGPTTVNSEAVLPQDWQYQVDLYNWLATLNEEDFITSPTSFTWDETYTDVESLSNLWLSFYGKRSNEWPKNTQIIRSEPKWFVLDNGNGAGIEGSGSVKIFRPASTAGLFYSMDLPLAGTGQGNPYYRSRGVGMRALVSIAVDMMMHDRLQDESPQYWSNVDFAGGAMLGWVWAYRQTRDLISPSVQAAFEQGFAYMAWKMLKWGAHDVNGNMDTKAVAALAHAFMILSDPTEKEWCLQAAKKILFGSTTGTPETTNYVNGLYRRAGYIDEGDSPETTYNGVSLFYMMEAHAVTRDESDWDFLDTVVESMIKFKVYQYFTDPDNFWDGPSGYAGRTGESYVRDQRNTLWRRIAAADGFEVGRPLTTERKFNKLLIKTEAEMVSDVNQAVAYANKYEAGTIYTVPPTNWSEEHWPDDNLYLPDTGWHTRLKILTDANDPTTLYPYEGTGNFNITFDDEFWSYKANDGTRDFGFFIETLADAGNYHGWYGGSLQAFWTRETGILLLARHDKSGNEVDQKENTRVWSQIDSWSTHHIWGRDEYGRAFSTAATDNLQHTVNYNSTGSTVAVKTVLSSAAKKGQETGSEIRGTVSFTNNFAAVANGLKITHTVTSDSADQISELWAVLPVFLRDTDQSMADTAIEYWNGSTWQELGTTLVSTKKIRLGRNFGDGLKYGYVIFEQARDVKLSDGVWVQSYQGNTRLRNIKIDMHGSPGTEISFPASAVLTMRIEASEMADSAPLAAPQNLRIE